MHRATDLAPRATIAQLCGIRDRALEQYARILADAKALNELVKPLSHREYALPTARLTIDRNRYDSTGLDLYRKNLDAAAWDHIMEATELRNLMGAQDRAKWAKQINEEPPPFTVENVTATFTKMRDEAPRIFRQGIVDLFEQLPKDFRSHDGFKIGARCVLQYAVNHWGPGYSWSRSSYGHDKKSQINDLDRTFHKLAGVPWTACVVDAASAVMKDGNTEAENRFFRLRWFQNGNCHVWFLDRETTAAANRLLAQHYGPALAKMNR